MDQHQPPQHFSDPYCALLTISDTRMADTLSVESEEVRVMRYQNSSRGCSKRNLRHIVKAEVSGFGRGRYVDATMAQTSRDAGRDVLVQMEANRHPLGWRLDLFRAKLGLD